MTPQAPAFTLHDSAAGPVLALTGDWTVWTVGAVDAELRAMADRLGVGVNIDISDLGRLDTAGAWLIDRTVRGGSLCGNLDTKVHLLGSHPAAARLLTATRSAVRDCPLPEPAGFGLIALLERLGRGAEGFWQETLSTLSFLGRALAVLGRLIRHPKRIRWPAVVTVMEQAGLNAAPIIVTLSFFVGLVVAYLGARVLADFGASVFTVELVAFAVFREFGVVITAIVLAGRTASAFTAEIGSMRMRQEIDAMRVMGIDPMEALVTPRLIGLLVMTPLLTFAAVMAGMLGGLLVCWVELGVSPALFIVRVDDGVPAQHFWVGLVKAPVFALVLALVGCRHGLEVGDDVVSLGRRTTTSVVQALFLVIVLDALFALWYLEMDW